MDVLKGPGHMAELERLIAHSSLLADVANSASHELTEMAAAVVEAVGLHRLPGGIRLSCKDPVYYDVFVSTGPDDTPHAFQRGPTNAAVAAAAATATAAATTAGVGASSELSATELKGISTFIIATTDPALRQAAHNFMASKTGTRGTVCCSLIGLGNLLSRGFAVWIDEINGCTGGIPLIFNATITPAKASVPVEAFVGSFLTMPSALCMLAAAAEPVEEFQLPPPALTDAVLATPAAKPLARHA